MRDRVEQGAKLLDKINPGWPEKVNLDRLAMRDCTRCIIGQVYGRYYSTLFDLRSDGDIVGYDSDYGFTLKDSQLTSDSGSERRERLWKKLADLWRAEVRARLAADAGGTPP